MRHLKLFNLVILLSFFVGFFSHAHGGFYTAGADFTGATLGLPSLSKPSQSFYTVGADFTESKFPQSHFTNTNPVWSLPPGWSKLSQSHFTNTNLFETLFLFPDTDLNCVDFTYTDFYVDFPNSRIGQIWQTLFTKADLREFKSKGLNLCWREFRPKR